MENTSLSANLNVNKFREIYDEVIEEIDREITIAIVGRGKVGKAEVGAWFLLNRDNLADGEVHGIIMGEYGSDIESSTAALSAADRADIILFVTDASRRSYRSDLPMWRVVRDQKKPYLLIGNKLDLSGGDAREVKHRLADVFGAPLNQIAVISAKDGTNVLEELLPRIVAVAKGLEIPLARRFPVFRKAVANRVTTATAAENSVIGVLIFLPAADMPVMTANQVKMILKIAVAYGQDISLERLKELMVVFGGAIAFRAAARNLAAFIPALGWAVKGGIAYGGTVALGKTAVKYFETYTRERVPAGRALKAGQEVIDV